MKHINELLFFFSTYFNICITHNCLMRSCKISDGNVREFYAKLEISLKFSRNYNTTKTLHCTSYLKVNNVILFFKNICLEYIYIYQKKKKSYN
jgi:hypothetical protein